MNAIIMTVCMVTQAMTCKDVSLGIDAENITPQQCMQLGQVEMSKWITEHPGWRITRWTCGRRKARIDV